MPFAATAVAALKFVPVFSLDPVAVCFGVAVKYLVVVVYSPPEIVTVSVPADLALS